MAITTGDIKGSYPLPGYNYKVVIGELTLGFTEVSGLQIAVEQVIFKQSPSKDKSVGPEILFMPGQGTPSILTMKRGVILGTKTTLRYLYNWISEIKANVVEKRDVFVYLMDEVGTEIVGWKAINAFPTSLDAPSFSASSNDAALETVVLMADNIQMLDLS
jgi:phage tail-like protein